MSLKRVLAVCLTAAMLLGSMFVAPEKQVSAATFTDLDQNEIVAEMGAGWNLGNQLEASVGGVPYETAWGNPTITEGLIRAVKAAGFSTIRIPVSYLSKIGSGSSYTIDSAWLDRVQAVVDMCIKNDLYVIINMHGDGYNSVEGGWLLCNGSDQNTIRAKYKACWKQIATRFKNYDEHLIFESMNEEFDGTYGTPNSTYYNNINQLNQIFVDTVRQTGGNNAMRWLLIPGWNTNIDYTAGNYGFKLPSDNYRSSSIPSGEKRIMISVHYYDPWGFCGEESNTYTQWGSAATNSSKVANYGDESYMKSQLNAMYSKFVTQGYPVVIGEYGAIDKSSADSNNLACRKEWAKKLCTYAKQYGCVPVWWDNGYNGTYGFGLFDRNSCKVTQQGIIDSIMSVYKNSGSSSGSGSSGSTGSTSGTVIFSNGSSDQSYSTSDASWLTGASDSAVITLSYTCTDSSHAYWGILGWGASVNGNWVNGNSYAAASNATSTVTVTFTAKELKSSLGISSGSSVDYLALSAYNGGKIISLSIAGSGSSSNNNNTGSSNNNTSTGTTTSGLEGIYYIKNVHSGLYLDVDGGSSANSANIQQWSFNGYDSQKFKVVANGDGTYALLTAASGYSKCVDISGAKAADGTNVLQYTYKGSANQHFKLEKQSDGSYAILTGASKYASGLDVYNWSTSAGGNVCQWNFWGGNCQKWYLEPAN